MNQLLILASPLDPPATAGFWEKLTSLLATSDDLSVYLLHEGAQSLADTRFSNPKIRLFACPRAVEAMGGTAWERATLGGPGLLAELIDRASSIHTFSPT